MTPSPVRVVAEEEGFPVLAPQRPRGEDFLAQIRDLEADLSVVVAYGHILEPEILATPVRGTVNVHASLLPELRGAAPVHWAILRGYSTTGISIIRLVPEMDAGPILFQTPEKIGPNETASELSARLSEVGAEALVGAMALMAEGAAQEVEQDHSRATFAPKVTREMARVDWSRPARELAWHLRGLDAVPGAWSTLGGESIKLFKPRPEPSYSHGKPPGTVLLASPEDGILVACGAGALRVGEIQSPGRKRMPVDAWLQGHGLDEGSRFE
jgi:methionyl-tRNA formyltransferase